jgi:hypothetical protein
MNRQPNRAQHLATTDDRVYTPPSLAQALAQHFAPTGQVLEPCEGRGQAGQAFTRALRQLPSARVYTLNQEDRGEDFLAPFPDHFPTTFAWVITNPPWSAYADFLARGFQVAQNVVYLASVNHTFTKARRALARQQGFGLRQVVEFGSPPTWPQSGFQMGAVHYQQGYDGPTQFHDWNGDQLPALVRAEYGTLAAQVARDRQAQALRDRLARRAQQNAATGQQALQLGDLASV